MPRKLRSTQNPKQALDWYRAYYSEHGRIPSEIETDALQGPRWLLRVKLGGLLGVAEALGLERQDYPLRCIQTEAQLKTSLSKWILSRGLDKPPTTLDAIAAFRAKDIITATPQTYRHRFGSWEDVLAETGLFRFRWTASECVGFAYRTRQSSANPDLKHAIRENAQKGVTPTLNDVHDFYPNLRTFSSNRINWGSWLQKDPSEIITRRNKISIVSHGVLALTSADGELADFEQANDILFKEDRGPKFSKGLFANIAPSHMSEKAGYVWALDFILRAYDANVNDSGDKHMPLNDLEIGSVRIKELVHPVFRPELEELKAVA